MSKKRIDFSEIDWECSPLGSRFKAFETVNSKVRLVEMVRADQSDLEWCRKGHIGYVVEGELEIVFANETIRYKAGDGISIAALDDEEHKPRAISEKVVLFLVEEI